MSDRHSTIMRGIDSTSHDQEGALDRAAARDALGFGDDSALDAIRALDRITELQYDRITEALAELRDAVTAQDEQIAELRELLTRRQDKALLADVGAIVVQRCIYCGERHPHECAA
jgi:hypothetical protein